MAKANPKLDNINQGKMNSERSKTKFSAAKMIDTKITNIQEIKNLDTSDLSRNKIKKPTNEKTINS
jgi:hypothetical protein